MWSQTRVEFSTDFNQFTQTCSFATASVGDLPADLGAELRVCRHSCVPEAAARTSSVHQRGDAQADDGDSANQTSQDEAAQQPGLISSHGSLCGGNFVLKELLLLPLSAHTRSMSTALIPNGGFYPSPPSLLQKWRLKSWETESHRLYYYDDHSVKINLWSYIHPPNRA